MTSKLNTINQESLTNYLSYYDPRSKRDRIGHYNLDKETVEPLDFISGAPVENLYQVIEVGEANIVSGGIPTEIANVKILPPITGRDVLCVGKNYAEHAKEFNSSGFDSSDKVDTPSHPVIFTKRHTSIIAHGEEIYPHAEFTQTLDYEGEIGVIIGKAGYRILEADAMSHVWGYTLFNDVTARERQRDHKQFYIGKSADTFCPMVRDTSWILKVLRADLLGSHRCPSIATGQSTAGTDCCERRVATRRHDGRSHLLDSISDQDNF
jgi:2-keto-4-pentenoate hydratase/2-oxohepta-3-ene-1,7-dioic acid hydratase in catechol pathway